jgi:hypothetical protein
MLFLTWQFVALGNAQPRPRSTAPSPSPIESAALQNPFSQGFGCIILTTKIFPGAIEREAYSERKIIEPYHRSRSVTECWAETGLSPIGKIWPEKLLATKENWVPLSERRRPAFAPPAGHSNDAMINIHSASRCYVVRSRPTVEADHQGIGIEDSYICMASLKRRLWKTRDSYLFGRRPAVALWNQPVTQERHQ